MEVEVVKVSKDKEVVALISDGGSLYIKDVRGSSGACFCLYAQDGGTSYFQDALWVPRLADAKTKFYKGDVIQITF